MQVSLKVTTVWITNPSVVICFKVEVLCGTPTQVYSIAKKILFAENIELINFV